MQEQDPELGALHSPPGPRRGMLQTVFSASSAWEQVVLTCTCLRRCQSRLLPAASLPGCMGLLPPCTGPLPPRPTALPGAGPKTPTEPLEKPPAAPCPGLAPGTGPGMRFLPVPLALSEQVVLHPLSRAHFPLCLTRELLAASWRHSSANNDPFTMKKGDFLIHASNLSLCGCSHLFSWS